MGAPRIVVSDDELAAAVVASASWAEVFAALGYRGRPGGYASQRIRDHARSIGLSTDHFVQPIVGPRRSWTDDDLRQAMAQESTWMGVERRLRTGHKTARRHAERLGIETSHLDTANHMAPPTSDALVRNRDGLRLHRAAEGVAIAWYSLHGFDVFIPSSSDNHADLLAKAGDQTLAVQVKSVRVRRGNAWPLRTQRRAPGERVWRAYHPGEIDELFALCSDGTIFVLPGELVAGHRQLYLGEKYARYRSSLF